MIRRVHEELRRLDRELTRVRLPLDLISADRARAEAAALHQQLSDYLLPRYLQWDAPLLVVVGGSTGAGKSTLVNALAGEEVSPVSAIRPTTRTPVLVHHPDDAHWFTSSRVLPRWSREVETAGPPSAEGEPVLRLRETRSIPAGLAIVDAPDIDSVEELNRERAAELLAAADGWIFATTAMRYADAVPWAYLADAEDRSVVVALVLGRVPGAHAAEVGEDLAGLLRQRGHGQVPIFTIIEKPPGQDPLTASELAPMRRWLQSLISAETRSVVITQTLHGATKQLLRRAETVRAAAAEQRAAHEELAGIVAEAYRLTPIEEALHDGQLLRGEVLNQWHEFLGTGEYFRRLEAGVSRARDRLGALWRRPKQATLKAELGHGFAGLLHATAAEAAARTYAAWTAHPGGVGLLTPDLAAPSGEVEAKAAAVVARWQEHVLELVRVHGASKRTGARIAAFGVNAVAVLLMILAFASTGGLVGAEVAIAGGAAVIAQRVLEAIFGEHGMRQLATEAQRELLAGGRTLLESEADRYLSRLPDLTGAALTGADPAGPGLGDPGLAGAIATAAAALDARIAGRDPS